MDKAEAFLAVVGTILISASLFIQILQWINVTPSALIPYSFDIVLIALAIGVIILVIVIVIAILRQTKCRLDPRFKRLHLYFSDRNDNPSSPNPHLPYYVENTDTRQAYYVPTLIQPYKETIAYNSWTSKESLLKHFKTEGIEHHEDYPSEWQLGLYQKPNGSIMYLTYLLDPEIAEELKKGKAKLQKYQIVYLNPRWFWFIERIPRFGSWVSKQIFPPSNAIIANTETHKSFQAPFTSLELVVKDIINHHRCTLNPWEKISGCSKRVVKCDYDANIRLTVEDLLAEIRLKTVAEILKES